MPISFRQHPVAHIKEMMPFETGDQDTEGFIEKTLASDAGQRRPRTSWLTKFGLRRVRASPVLGFVIARNVRLAANPL